MERTGHLTSIQQLCSPCARVFLQTEFSTRKAIFTDNMKFIASHNAREEAGMETYVPRDYIALHALFFLSLLSYSFTNVWIEESYIA